MIYDLQTTNRFKKNYKKMQKRGLKREDLEFVVDKLRNGARLEHKYKDHALSEARIWICLGFSVGIMVWKF